MSRLIPASRVALSQYIRHLGSRELPPVKHILKQTKSKSIDKTNELLLILISKRLLRFGDLSYLTLLNPHISKIWNAYLESFSSLLHFNPPTVPNDVLVEYEPVSQNQQSGDMVSQYKSILEEILEMHTDNVIDLNQGIKETNIEELKELDESGNRFQFAGLSEKDFLDEHLSERILLRLIIHNFLYVNHEGVVNENIDISNVLLKSIDFVNGMSELKYNETIDFNLTFIQITQDYPAGKIVDRVYFNYIENHIEYIINEILKNATRASIENSGDKNVQILVVLDKIKNTLQFKITDFGGGIKPSIISKLWDYSFTTVNNVASTSSGFDSGKDTQTINTIPGLLGNDDNIIAGMGYGLPLSLTYCKLFGGNIKLQSIWGKGTDVYITLKGL